LAKLLQTGDYSIRPLNRDASTPYLITKRTAEQKSALISQLPKPPESRFFKTGEAIRAFNIKDISGKKLNAKDWAGKTIVLNFWMMGSPPCQQEIPELNKIVASYVNNPNVVFISIAPERGYQIVSFVKENPFNYRLVSDGLYYTDRLRVNLYPTNVVIDRQGKICFHSSGYELNTPYWINKAIQESEQKAM
jgi:thiol-disulfide isomerase/thioredoxin